MSDLYRHKVRGTTYRILFEAAKMSTASPDLDDTTMVVYQGETDGLVWVRPAIEFFDGRFEKLPEPSRSADWHYDSQGYCDKPWTRLLILSRERK